jgi:hypothetical protein
MWAISTLASRLNSSPLRCSVVPLPDEAKVTLPLFSWQNAMNSFTDFAGDEFGTHIRLGWVISIVTGSKSPTGS